MMSNCRDCCVVGARARAEPPGESSRLLYRMTAEFVSQSGDHFRRERVGLPRAEPRQQREGDDWRGDIEIDCLLNGPSPFPGILHVAAQRAQLAIFRERYLGELIEPRTDDASVIPDRGDLVQIELEV